jgi:predicted DNA-binding protein with PD1-like motif
VKAQRIGGNGQTTHVLVFDKGDEVVEQLLAFAQQENLTAASFTAIGAFSDVTLGFFERERKDYRRIPLAEQVEVLTLGGDIAVRDGNPQVHAHAVVGKADGTAWGGHLLEGHVWPTLELVLVESPAELRRTLDEETGLPLITIEPPPPAGGGEEKR